MLEKSLFLGILFWSPSMEGYTTTRPLRSITGREFFIPKEHQVVVLVYRSKRTFSARKQQRRLTT